MNKILHALLQPALVLFLLTACGEDRTYEYEEKTETAHWIETVMREQYLWGDSLKELKWTEYFGSPITFFNKLTAQAPISDSWSWCSIDTLDDDAHRIGHFNRFDSYGLDFSIVTDPTGQTSRQFALITMVFDDSPAASCGLKRGDYITHIGASRPSNSNTSYLESGGTRSLTVCRLRINETSSAYIWSDTTTVQLPASRPVALPAFSDVSTFQTAEGTLAYLKVNRLASHLQPASTADIVPIRQQLQQAVEKLRNVQAQIAVLDFRHCNEGSLDEARTLASYFVAVTAQTATFAQTFHRSDRSSDNQQWAFDATCTPLQLKYLFVITSEYTSGAAEWLIRGIRYAMPSSYLYTVGATTAGQVVITSDITTPYLVTLHPAVAYVGNGSGDYNYSDGLAPDISIDDSSSRLLGAYGTADETLLGGILSEIEQSQ
jgi:C-terminal processing protease CtpA/Prc